MTNYSEFESNLQDKHFETIFNIGPTGNYNAGQLVLFLPSFMQTIIAFFTLCFDPPLAFS